MEKVSELIKEAVNADVEDFIRLAEKTLETLKREKGKIGRFEVISGLVKVKPVGEAIVVGDVHGDIESLAYILEHSGFLAKDSLMIFLGDYGDRGAYSAEVYYTVMKLKLAFPERVILLRGNHEGPEDLLPCPYDLPAQFKARFGEKGDVAHRKIRELFAFFRNAAIVEKRVLMVHGGIPAKAKSLKDIAQAHLTHPQQSFLEEILWSDPHEALKGVAYSPRGAGKLFGADVTDRILRLFDVKAVVRGHEPCMEGFKINHNGKVLTLFSRKGAPYYNKFGAYLCLRLSETLENAEQLLPHIHRF